LKTTQCILSIPLSFFKRLKNPFLATFLHSRFQVSTEVPQRYRLPASPSGTTWLPACISDFSLTPIERCGRFFPGVGWGCFLRGSHGIDRFCRVRRRVIGLCWVVFCPFFILPFPDLDFRISVLFFFCGFLRASLVTIQIGSASTFLSLGQIFDLRLLISPP